MLFHGIHCLWLCTPLGPIFCLAIIAKDVGKQNGDFAIEFPAKTERKFMLSIEAPHNSGTSSTTQTGKWGTSHDGTLFGPEVRVYFPPRSTLVFDTDCFLQWRRALSTVKTTRSTSHFFGRYR